MYRIILTTKIDYSIPVSGHVKLSVYNMLGSEVATIVNEYKEAGNHPVELSTEQLDDKIGSGVYIFTSKAGSFTQTGKIVVLK